MIHDRVFYVNANPWARIMANKNIGFTRRLKLTLETQGYYATRSGKKEFAKKVDIPYTTFSPYLKDKNNGKVPAWAQLVIIADGLKVSVDWLLTGEEPTNPTDHDHLKDTTYPQDSESLLEIYNHGNPKTIGAIHANLEEFVEKVRSEKERAKLEGTIKSQGATIKNMGKTIKAIIQEMEDMKSKMATLEPVPSKEASSNT